MLGKAFGNSTMSQKNVYKWYKDFKEGRERVDDLKRSGRPSTSTDDQCVNKVKEGVLTSYQLTVKDLTDMIGISEASVKTILRDHFGLRKVKSRLVPKTQNFLGKGSRLDLCETMLSDYQDFQDKRQCIITAAETWIYACDPETTDQSSEYRAKVKPRKRARQSRKKIKDMMTVFFDFHAVRHYEFLPSRQTVRLG